MSGDPQLAREFAFDVVRKLRAAGYEALWAGGCVRDQLLGLKPKDYDVATDATPEQIRQVFGRRRTLPIGAAFGVMTVIAPQKEAGQIEVATFRRDAPYSDGRHPDSVTFSTAQEDAQRRDFTINGLFYDPVEQRVIDYVGGQQDLERRVVRAIGNARDRLNEDKLRMLRAVRFAATFDFQLDEDTLAAIQERAEEILQVSAERISGEMQRMLVHEHRVRAVELLVESRLLEVVLPELFPLLREVMSEEAPTRWQRTLAVLGRLKEPTFAMALAALIRETAEPALHVAQEIGERWRLANEHTETVLYLLREEFTIRRARYVPWPRLQRLLMTPRIEQLLGYCEAVAQALDGQLVEIEYCREKLRMPPEQLNPAPLISGNDLKAIGIPTGPIYARILTAVRDGQLEGSVQSRDQALAFARQVWDNESRRSS